MHREAVPVRPRKLLGVLEVFRRFLLNRRCPNSVMLRFEFCLVSGWGLEIEVRGGALIFGGFLSDSQILSKGWFQAQPRTHPKKFETHSPIPTPEDHRQCLYNKRPESFRECLARPNHSLKL